MFKKYSVLLAISFTMAGCSVQPAKIVYQNPETTQKVNVYSLIEQDELDALYPIQDSSAVSSQFGLVGALVGASIDAGVNAERAEIAEQNLTGIRNELIEFDFDKIFLEEVTKKLKNNVHISSIVAIKSNEQLEDDIKDGDTYLTLNTSYKMDMDFRTPFIITEVSISQKATDEKLYKNTFTYYGHSLPAPDIANLSEDELKLINLTDDQNPKLNPDFDPEFDELPEDRELPLEKVSASKWTTEYKGQLEQHLRKGIQNLLTLISNDIKDKTQPTEYIDKGITPEGYPVYHQSIVVEENDENKVIRFTSAARAGAICSMPVKHNEGKLLCL